MSSKKLPSQVSIVENTLQRIASHEGVRGCMVVRPSDGFVLMAYGFDDQQALASRYASTLLNFATLTAYTVRNLDVNDALSLLRIRLVDCEFIILPDVKNEHLLIVIQERTHETLPI